LAVVGANGAGKSTLLGAIAGLCRPDQGRITVRGRICPLLQLGAGFHPDLTGAENITLNGALLGLGRARLEALRGRIVEFSGVAPFIDEPLRAYSSGMVLRLAFSVAIHVDPDVLVIDELLSVGDPSFQESCLAKIRELRAAGKTLVCASHDLNALRSLCDEAVWLDRGRLVSAGPIDAVLAGYPGAPAAVG
jgi:ABC-type polysaccharide/polyol phosphate transport system ATPase subunit